MSSAHDTIETVDSILAEITTKVDDPAFPFTAVKSTYENTCGKQYFDRWITRYKSSGITDLAARSRALNEIRKDVEAEARRADYPPTLPRTLCKALVDNSFRLAYAAHKTNETLEQSWRINQARRRLLLSVKQSCREAKHRDQAIKNIRHCRSNFMVEFWSYVESVRDGIRAETMDDEGRKHPLSAMEIESGEIEHFLLADIARTEKLKSRGLDSRLNQKEFYTELARWNPDYEESGSPASSVNVPEQQDDLDRCEDRQWSFGGGM